MTKPHLNARTKDDHGRKLMYWCLFDPCSDTYQMPQEWDVLGGKKGNTDHIYMCRNGFRDAKNETKNRVPPDLFSQRHYGTHFGKWHDIMDPDGPLTFTFMVCYRGWSTRWPMTDAAIDMMRLDFRDENMFEKMKGRVTDGEINFDD